MSDTDRDKEVSALQQALVAALQDPGFLDTLSAKVAARLNIGAPGAARTPVDVWRDGLASLAGPLDADCTAERAAELFPLSTEEVGRVVSRIRTDTRTAPVTLETLRQDVIAQLGDDVLMARTAAMADAKAGRPGCGGEYECGHTYHCGHEVSCGTPYEWLPCGHLYNYGCGPAKSCGKPYLCGTRYLETHGRSEDAARRPCTGAYQCGQPFHCGHEVSCGTPYEYLPCDPVYDYFCRPTKSCGKPYMCGTTYR